MGPLIIKTTTKNLKNLFNFVKDPENPEGDFEYTGTPVLYEIDHLPIIAPKKCREMYDKINYVHGYEEDKEFCVYAEGKDSCVVSFFFHKKMIFFFLKLVKNYINFFREILVDL